MALVRCRATATLISPTHYYEAGEEFVCEEAVAAAHGASVVVLERVGSTLAEVFGQDMVAPPADRMVKRPPRARARRGRFTSATAGVAITTPPWVAE